jgi:rRNA biogenesis protein RRP5
VTHKKSLVDSALPILSSYEDAVAGAAHHGFLTSVRSNGCVVKFFNNVQAFIPRVHLSAVDDITDPEKYFHLGQTVKAFVLNVDVAQSRLLATLKPGVTSEKQSSAQFATLSAGSLVDVVVDEHTDHGMICRVSSETLSIHFLQG